MRKKFTKLELTIWELVNINSQGFTSSEIVYIIQQLMADA